MKNAILDTNVFLHWDVKSVDWCKELKTDVVIITVPITVVKELDEKKKDPNRTLADRARRNLSLIESHNLSGTELRAGVTIKVLASEPRVDWEKEELDPNIKDDRIIAKIIERKNKDDILVTDDTTPRIKAQLKKIPTVEISAPKLEEPKNDLEKKLEKANQELVAYKERSPELRLHLETEVNDKIPTFMVRNPTELPDAEIDRLVEARRAELDIDFGAGKSSPFHIIPFASFIDIPGYRADVQKHLQEYRLYLKNKNDYERDMAGMIMMQFKVVSEGKVPADDVYCRITFPEGFEIFEKDTFPSPPAEPRKPVPTNALTRIISAERLSPLMYDAIRPSFGPVREQPIVKIESNEIKIRVPRINHGFAYKPEAFFVKVPSLDNPKNFEIDFELHASNLPVFVEGSIPVGLGK